MPRQMKDSGIEWVDEIPAEWDIVRIKNLYDYRNEKNFKPLEEVNLISLYTDLGVVQHCDLETTTGNKASNADGYKLVYEDDIVVNIILCWMGAIGRSAYTGVTSPAYDVYAPKKGTNSRFYHYLFRTQGFSGDCYKVGRGIMAMRWRTYSDQFRAIKVVAPPPDEQERIAKFLNQKCVEIDAVIAKTKATIEEYKKLKQSIIMDAVTNGIHDNRHMKDSGVEWIGEVPTDWSVKKLKYTAEFKQNTYSDNDGELPYIGLENIAAWNGRFSETDSVYDREQSLICEPNDILFGKLRPYLAKVYINPQKQCCSGEFCVISIQKQNTKYMWYQLISHGFIFMVDRSTYGTKMPRANADFIRNMSVSIPPVDEQEEIANYLDAKCAEMDALIDRKTALLEEMKSYKNSVIYEYITGKKEVPWDN